MKYLVDANVLSETTKPSPAVGAVEWLRRNETEIAVDPIILGELRFGILLLPAGIKRKRLEQWFEGVVQRIQCLPWDSATALRWAELLATLRKKGLSMPVKDSLIVATALVHRLTIVTRNNSDFAKAGVDLIDPFV